MERGEKAKMVKTEQVQYTNISAPHIASPDKPVLISDQTYAKHMNRLQSAMQKEGFDAVVIYADKEHGDNFYYCLLYTSRCV